MRRRKHYAAAVCVRNELNDGRVMSSCLVAAKSRLASLKAVSIPRLIELRLTKQVCMALEVPVSGATYWIDSHNVEFWIIQGVLNRVKNVIVND